MFKTSAVCICLLAVFLSGCTTTPPPQQSGSVQLTSSPSGAEIYLDMEYHGTTPAVITAVPAGNHTIEIRKSGYERWSGPVTVTAGNVATVSAILTSIPATQPVIFVTTTSPSPPGDRPRIHVDGYWTAPQGISDTSGPAWLLVHADGFNVGYADAREVTVSANLYYEGRQICWNTVYLGTLKAGDHVTKDTMISCTLPSLFRSSDLVVRFENIIVTS